MNVVDRYTVLGAAVAVGLLAWVTGFVVLILSGGGW